MRKIIIGLSFIVSVITSFSQTTCSGTITGNNIPAYGGTVATTVLIGNGSQGTLKVCLNINNIPSGKCTGNSSRLYIFESNGTTLIADWYSSTPVSKCITLPTCNGYARLAYFCGVGNGTTISWSTVDLTNSGYKNSCTGDIILPAALTDCSGALQICDTGTYLGNTNGSGIQELGCNTPTNGKGCLLNGENNSAWYWFKATSNGTITFAITPATNKDDYDFAVYGPNPTSCTTLDNPIRCNFALGKGATGLNSTVTATSENGGCVNGSGCTNTGYSKQLTVITDEIYYLLVDGFATAIDPNYSINFGGTASIQCPVPLFLDNTNTKPIVILEEDLPEPLKIIRRWNASTIQEVDKDYKGLQIIMYEDGTRSKKYIE